MIEAGTNKSNPTSRFRRVLPRYRADMRVRIALSTPIPVIVHARAANLSKGGIGVVLPQESSSRVVAMIGLKTPDRDTDVWFHVGLRHRCGFRCGFQFLGPTPEQKSFLRRICRSLTA